MADGSIFRQPAPCGENPHGPMDTWKDLVEIQIFFRDFHECPIFLAKGKDYFTSDFNHFLQDPLGIH